MKLAEALIIRADARKRIAQIQERLGRNISVQEGGQPPEDPQELLRELDRTIAEFTRLAKNVNRTNASTPFDGDITLTDALANRDALSMRHSALSNVIRQAASFSQQTRYSLSEIRQVVTVDIAVLQKQADDIARQFRELDTAIQQMNWQIDLLEDDIN
ncbi:MAG: DIP1984 family protein [Aggregatilineales bacterium]